MSGSHSISDLMPLGKCATQAYFSNRIQLAQVIDWVVAQTGPCHMTVSTFSTSEEFIRRLWRQKRSGQILSCTMYCDLKATRKTLHLYRFMSEVFDSVGLCQNHSKSVLLTNSSHAVGVVTSQNQTRGDRFECGIITSDPVVTANLRDNFAVLSLNSLPLEYLIENRGDQ